MERICSASLIFNKSCSCDKRVFIQEVPSFPRHKIWDSDGRVAAPHLLPWSEWERSTADSHSAPPPFSAYPLSAPCRPSRTSSVQRPWTDGQRRVGHQSLLRRKTKPWILINHWEKRHKTLVELLTCNRLRSGFATGIRLARDIYNSPKSHSDCCAACAKIKKI